MLCSCCAGRPVSPANASQGMESGRPPGYSAVPAQHADTSGRKACLWMRLQGPFRTKTRCASHIAQQLCGCTKFNLSHLQVLGCHQFPAHLWGPSPRRRTVHAHRRGSLRLRRGASPSLQAGWRAGGALRQRAAAAAATVTAASCGEPRRRAAATAAPGARHKLRPSAREARERLHQKIYQVL